MVRSPDGNENDRLMLIQSGKTTAGLLLAVMAIGVLASAVPAAAQPAPDGLANVTSAAPSGGVLEALLFYGVAIAVVTSALGVCVSKNIVRMATWLFFALGSVAILFFMLAANFLGAIQLIVYVGGTLVLLVFGVMLTSRSPWARFGAGKVEIIGASVVCGALFLSLCVILGRGIWSGVTGTVPGVAVIEIGRSLLTTYVVPFEVAGVLLMIVMVGAAHLARQGK